MAIPMLTQVRLWFQKTPADLTSLSKRDTVMLAKRSLQALGWEATAIPHASSYACDFAVEKEGTYLNCGCGGVDKPLSQYMIRDLRRISLRSKRLAIFVSGHMATDQCLRMREDLGATVVSIMELSNIERIIEDLNPVVHGGIDRIILPRIIQGWACFTPDKGPASLEAFVDSEVIGTSVADRLRRDLSQYRKGNVGFRIEASRDLDRYDVYNRLAVRASHGGRLAGKVLLWSKVIIE